MEMTKKIAKAFKRALGRKKMFWPTQIKAIPWKWYDYLTGRGSPFNRKQWENRKHKDYRSHAVGDLVHNGSDVRAYAGDRIFAICSGLICFSAYIKGYGWTIVISHGQGIYTLYAHLAKAHRSPVGTAVVGGYEIAYSGMKGVDHSYAPHLHVEGRYREREKGYKASALARGWHTHDPENLWYFNIMENIMENIT